MPYTREPVDSYQTQVDKLANNVAKLAAIKLSEECLQEASKIMAECSAAIEKIYNNAQTKTSTQHATLTDDTSAPITPQHGT